MSSVDVSALAEGIDELDARALAVRLGEVERAIRALEAVATPMVATADRRELFREDGYASVRGWVKSSIRVSDQTVTHRVRTAKLVTSLPVCGEELAAGRLGVDQVRELARVHANPRCGDQLGAAVDELVRLAEIPEALPYGKCSTGSCRPSSKPNGTNSEPGGGIRQFV
jgi:Domain of unknown function (DUF222)